jgi:hypothetical protein
MADEHGKFSRPYDVSGPAIQSISYLDLDASDVLGPLFEQYQDVLESLKLVEYVGDEKGSTCYQLNEVNVKLQIYQLYDEDQSFQEHADIPQAQVANMPHVRFDGQWDEYAVPILLPDMEHSANRTSDLSSRMTSKESSSG